MNIQQLEYIQALDKFRHFGRAADYCQVTQPTLSTMIQKLEDELGVKIFDRSHQPIIPTAVGRRILDQAAVILLQVAQVKEVIREEQEALSGSLRLGVLPTVAPYLLPLVLPLLRKQLPDLKITITELKTSECVAALLSGQIDVALTASASKDELLIDRPLYYEEFLGYVPRKSELFDEKYVHSAEVGRYQLWLLDEGHCFRDQLVKFCHLKNAPSQRVTYSRGSLETFMHFVEQGNGVTFVPELAVKTLTPERRAFVRPFALPRPARCVTLVHHRDYVRHAVIERLTEVIQRAVPAEMLRLRTGQDLV